MTNGAAAALALSSRMLGGRMDWSSAFASWSPHELSGLLTAMQSNLEVGFNLARGWITPATRTGPSHPNEDEGGLVADPRGIWKPDAGSTAPSTVFHRYARTLVGS